MKKKNWISKSVSLVTSILLIVLGVLAIFAKDFFSSALGLISGIFLIAIGVLSIVYAVAIKKMILGSGWLIVQGILAIVLGIALATIQDASITVISMILATWLVIRGVAKMWDSTTLRRFRVSTWWLTLTLGALYFILGIFLYIFNSFTNDLIIVLIGVFFIVSGCLNIVELFDISKREKREERIINSLNKSIDNDVDHIDIDFTKDKKD